MGLLQIDHVQLLFWLQIRLWSLVLVERLELLLQTFLGLLPHHLGWVVVSLERGHPTILELVDELLLLLVAHELGVRRLWGSVSFQYVVCSPMDHVVTLDVVVSIGICHNCFVLRGVAMTRNCHCRVTDLSRLAEPFRRVQRHWLSHQLSSRYGCLLFSCVRQGELTQLLGWTSWRSLINSLLKHSLRSCICVGIHVCWWISAVHKHYRDDLQFAICAGSSLLDSREGGGHSVRCHVFILL